MLIGFNKSDLTYGYRPKVDYCGSQQSAISWRSRLSALWRWIWENDVRQFAKSRRSWMYL